MRCWLSSIGYFVVIVASSFTAATRSFAALADQAESVPPAKVGPHHLGTISSINLGIRYSSVLQSRGLILYRDFQIDPVLGVFLFDDRFEYLGDSIGYRDDLIKDVLRLRTRIVAISDKPLFPNHASIRNKTVHRTDSYEWSNRLELFLPSYTNDYAAEIDLEYAKDLVANHGSYVETLVKVKLFSARVPTLGTKIEPNVLASVGWGDAKFNSYFYGPNTAKAGLNNIAYGIWCAFPEEADRYYPIIQLKYFRTVGRSDQGDYAVGNNRGWLFSFIATAGLLE